MKKRKNRHLGINILVDGWNTYAAEAIFKCAKYAPQITAIDILILYSSLKLFSLLYDNNNIANVSLCSVV